MTASPVNIHHEEDVVVARLAGDIDLALTGTITREVLTAVSNESIGLVVDLSDVRYLDSAGIQMLFGFVRELEAGRQGMAVVVGTASPVRHLLELTSMHQAATVCATCADATAAVRAGAGHRS